MNTRRNFLKTSLLGAGAFSFSPYINAMSSPTVNSPLPKRFVFIRVTNGLWPNKLSLPDFSNELKEKEKNKQAFEVALDKHELPDYLKCLNDHKENMTILQGMSSQMSLNGHHNYQSIMGLFQAKKGNINALKRTSIDFELANLFTSPLGHVELSFANGRKGIVPGWSVPSPYQQNFCYADPITAYNNLFQCVFNPESLKLDIDMFSHIHKTESRKTSSVNGADKNAHINQLRSIEAIKNRNNKLLKMSSQIARQMPDKKMILSKGNDGAFMIEKQEAMTEILSSILVSGLTNVVTYTMENLDFVHTGLPGLEKLRIHNHAIGHNDSVGGISAEKIREKVRIHQFKQVKTIVDKLKAQPEGNGTMFDNTMVMFFPEGGSKHHGGGDESPWVLMSGKNCNLDIAGRYIRFPYIGTQGHQTLGNWYTSLLNAHGNPVKHYGDLDSTMTRKRLPQEGAIKRFLKA